MIFAIFLLLLAFGHPVLALILVWLFSEREEPTKPDKPRKPAPKWALPVFGVFLLLGGLTAGVLILVAIVTSWGTTLGETVVILGILTVAVLVFCGLISVINRLEGINQPPNRKRIIAEEPRPPIIVPKPLPKRLPNPWVESDRKMPALECLFAIISFIGIVFIVLGMSGCLDGIVAVLNSQT